jgi:hypothetical protein
MWVYGWRLPAYWSIVSSSCGYGCGRPVVIVMVDSSSSCWRKALLHSPFHFGRTKRASSLGSSLEREPAHVISFIFDRHGFPATIQKGSLNLAPVSTDLLLTSSYSCKEGSTACLRERRRGCAAASEDGCLVSLSTTPARRNR